MYCLIRNDMKFGEYFIPAGTKATVIYTPNHNESNVEGLDLYLAISLCDMALKQKSSVPLNEVEINNEFESHMCDSSKMTGITIRTYGSKVFMDAGDDFYENTTIYDFDIRKVLETKDIPEEIKKAKYKNPPYYLRSLVEYLENEFTKWVQDNCEFYTYTEKDIENGECAENAEPGDITLSPKGLEQFKNKKSEYQSKLKKIGFTYEFEGGLIWE